MIRRVHVIDDDEAVRDSLAAMLEAEGLAVSTYSSATAFVAALDRVETGCVVTDVRMPQLTGLDLLRALQDRRERFPTIVLTGEADVPMAVEALKGGALDFIQKPYAAETILDAVRSALARLQPPDEDGEPLNDDARRLAALSAREREVLDGVLAGRSNKEIARDLGISYRTVEAYRAKLMVKMGAESIPELVRLALAAKG